MQQVKEELKAAEEELAAAEAARDELALRIPNLPAPRHPGRLDRGRRRRGAPRRRAAGPRRRRASTPRSAASRWSAPRRCPARASATGSATPRCSRSRSTGSRSTGSPRKASPPVLPPVLVREEALIGTGCVPVRRGEHLRARRGRPLPRRHRRDPARRACTRARSSTADELPLRYVGLLAVLPPRGRRRRHATRAG